MLGAILGSGRGCVATPESQFLTDLVAKASWPAGLLDRDAAWSCLTRDYRFSLWGVDGEGILRTNHTSIKLRCLIEQLVLAYAAQHGRGRTDIWVDHTPGSQFIVPYLAEMFHDAKFLHLVRDGRAVAASILPLDWGPVNILDSARRWSREVAAGLAAETSPVLKGRIRRVRYEDILMDPVRVVADLCEFCGIAFEDSMIEGKGFLLPRYTRDQHALVGSRPQADRASQWKSRLSPRQIEIFEADAGGLLQLLGYSTEFWPDAARQSGYEACVAKLRKLLMGPYNFLRHKRRLRQHFQDARVRCQAP